MEDLYDTETEDEVLEDKIQEENIQTPIHLDYSLKTMEARNELVERIIAATPQAQLTSRYLEILGDYIMGALTKEQRKEKFYITENRAITINKRETSFEGLIEKFENGEDGIYALITENKNMLFQPKNPITARDVEEIPGLKELRDEIEKIEAAAKAATGKRKYLLKKQLIEMRKDQYVLKGAFKPAMVLTGGGSRGINKIDLSEKRYIDKDGNPQSTGLISFFNPDHISALMCHYNALKLQVQGHYWDDFFYLLEDFDKLKARALNGYPVLQTIADMKIDGKSNIEIQQALKEKHQVEHSIQYISSLWRNKIPKIIAEQEQNDYLIWHYRNVEQGQWKKCSCCGQYKLANNRFFSKNNTSKDGLYSICKRCRNQKNGQK